MTRNLEPKLGNFKYARKKGAETKNLSNVVKIIYNWMAPELIKKYMDGKYKENVYTFNCEMFRYLLSDIIISSKVFIILNCPLQLVSECFFGSFVMKNLRIKIGIPKKFQDKF